MHRQILFKWNTKQFQSKYTNEHESRKSMGTVPCQRRKKKMEIIVTNVYCMSSNKEEEENIFGRRTRTASNDVLKCASEGLVSEPEFLAFLPDLILYVSSSNSGFKKIDQIATTKMKPLSTAKTNALTVIQ